MKDQLTAGSLALVGGGGEDLLDEFLQRKELAIRACCLCPENIPLFLGRGVGSVSNKMPSTSSRAPCHSWRVPNRMRWVSSVVSVSKTRTHSEGFWSLRSRLAD